MQDNANPDAQPTRGKRSAPGPKGVPLPGLRDRLDRLLQAHGRSQQWLADALNATSPAIAGWKTTEQMPPHRLMAICTMLGIDRRLLTDPDPSAFDGWVDALLAVGSGGPWRALLNECDPQDPGLGFVPRIEPRPPRLRGVRPDRLGPSPVRHAEIGMSDKLVFELDPSCMPTTHDWKPAHVVLVLEDPERVQCLCPSTVRGGFAVLRARWQFPGPGAAPLVFHEPIGPHRAIAIACRDPLPDGIVDELTGDAMLGDARRLVPAFDRLAVWLRGGVNAPAVPHATRQFRFTLLPRRAGDPAQTAS